MVVKAQWWKTPKYCAPGIGFPLLLLVIGVYYLLKSLGYISEDVPFWPVILIAIAVYMLGKRLLMYTRR